MSAITQSVAAAHMGTTSPPRKPIVQEEPNKQAMGSGGHRDDDDRPWQRVAARKTQQVTHKLVGTDWSVPVVQEVPYQKDGIILAETQQKAEEMARAHGSDRSVQQPHFLSALCCKLGTLSPSPSAPSALTRMAGNENGH